MDNSNQTQVIEQLRERTKELSTLYAIAKSLAQTSDLPTIVQQVVTALPPGFYYPEEAVAEISLFNTHYASSNYTLTPWQLSSPIILNSKTVGQITVCYLHEVTKLDNATFLPEEQNLLNGIAELLSSLAKRHSTQLQLAEEATLKSTILQTALDGFCICDQKGNIIEVNDAYCKMSGFSKNELLKMTISDIETTENLDEINQHIKKIIENGFDCFETIHRRKDGTLFNAEISVQFHDRRIVSFIRDITTTKETLNNLKQANRHFKAIFDASPVGLLLLDKDARITENNQAISTMILRSPAEIIGKLTGGALGCINADKDKGCTLGAVCGNCPLRQAIEMALTTDRKIHGIEVQLTLKINNQPSKRWLRIDAEPVNLTNGAKLLVAISDITDAKLAEHSLRQERERYAGIINATQAGTWDWNIRTGELVLNERWAEIVGYTLAEMTPTSIDTLTQIAHPDDLIMSTEALEDHFCGKSEFYDIELRIRHKQGHWIWIHIRGQVYERDHNGQPLFMHGTNQEITARKMTELTLLEREHEYRMLFENMSAGFAVHEMIWDEQGKPLDYRFLQVNPAFEKMTGLKASTLIGHTIREVLPETEDYWLKKYAQVAKTGQPNSFQNYSKELNKWFDVRAFSPKKEQFATIIIDISLRKKTETALKEREARLAEAQWIAHLGSWELNLQTNHLTWSDEIFHIFEINQEQFEATYEGFLNTIHPDDRDMVNEAYTKSLENREPYSIVHRLLMTDGRIKYVHEQCRTEFDDSGKPLRSIGTVQDITQQHESEEQQEELQSQLYQSQKMDAIGKLAGGVAHDYNNMLCVILGNTEELLLHHDVDDHFKHALLQIKKAATRSAGLTKQLLMFSRQQPISPIPLELNTCVESMLKMLRRLIGEDITIQWLPSPHATAVFMDPVQIDQMLANLCVNGRDAIKEDGQITIETDVAVADTGLLARHPYICDTEFVILRVKDNGCGIEPELQQKIFEPFFTTKAVGQGTGLGLSTVFGIIEQNNGFIEVDSQVGSGTCFSIYLPRHEIVSAQAEQIQPEQFIAGGNETILLVEDEEMLLEMAKDVLITCGYNVLTANTPTVAIDTAATADTIDLLITDIIMPQINGIKLAEKIKEQHSSVIALFMSGYTGDVISEKGFTLEDNFFLPKPFKPSDLAAKVRKVLDSIKQT